MPDWCENEWYIEEDVCETDLEEVLENLRDDEGNMTFGKIVPMPDIYHGMKSGCTSIDDVEHRRWFEEEVNGKLINRPLTAEEEAEAAKHGYQTWYDWCCAKWGTKWDAQNSVFEIDRDPGGQLLWFKIKFETAWSPPEPFYLALQEKYPGLMVDAFWKNPSWREAGWL